MQVGSGGPGPGLYSTLTWLLLATLLLLLALLALAWLAARRQSSVPMAAVRRLHRQTPSEQPRRRESLVASVRRIAVVRG